MDRLKGYRIALPLAAVLSLTACDPFADDAATGDRAVAPAAGESHNGEKHGADRHDAAAGQDGHAGEERVLHLTQAQRDRLDLTVARAEAGSATAVVRAPATVRFDADRMARVGPRLEAKVVAVVRDLGDRVESGDTLAVLDSVELGRAKARYLTAAARYESAAAHYRRDRKLAERQIVSEGKLLETRADYREARAARDAARAELRLYGLGEDGIEAIAVDGERPLSRYELIAPIGGTVQRRDLVPGQTVSAQETPIHIVDNERMWVMIEAFERDLPRLQTGRKVELTVRALPGRIFVGETDWVSRELDERARTVRVRAVVPNEDGALRAGMFGTARVATDSEQRFALVPVDAVQTVDDDRVVFVPGDEAGAFRAATVTTGDESGGQVEIRAGLEPGDRVVTAGAFDLKSALTAAGRSAAHSH